MSATTLTYERTKGVKTSVLVIMLVLFLFVLIMIAGRPIMYFGNESPSLLYAVAVYIPVLAVCILAYKRLR